MRQKRKICGLAVLLVLSILCSIQVQAGAVQDQIDSAGKKIHELENALEQTGRKISAYQKEQSVLEQEIASGQEEISRLSAELDDTRAAITGTKEEIVQTQEALEQTKKDCKEQYIQMKQRIRFMYENSTTDMIICVLESDSMPEALRRANYFQAVMSYDREKLEEFKAAVKKIKQEKTKLVSEKEQLEALEAKQNEQLSGIDTAVAELKNKLGDKLAQIQSSKALQAEYAQDLENQKRYEQELERQKAEEDRRREEEIRKQEEELKRIRREEQERKEREEQAAQEEQRQQGSGSGSSPDTGNDSGSTLAGAGDLELLSTIIYCEAGSQSYEGQLAVGSVIMNRVASSSFPNSISGVIYQSGQFSPVASGRFAHALAAGLGSRCTPAAREVLNGRRNVDCLYFRTDNGVIDGLVIGDHVFY